MTTASAPSAPIGLVDLRAEAARFDPDDRIDAGIVLLTAVEDADANRVFLQLVAFAGERPLDDVAQESTQPIGVGEEVAGQDPVELPANLVGGGFHSASMDQSSAGSSAARGGRRRVTNRYQSVTDCVIRPFPCDTALVAVVIDQQEGGSNPCSTSCNAYDLPLAFAGVLLVLPRVAEAARRFSVIRSMPDRRRPAVGPREGWKRWTDRTMSAADGRHAATVVARGPDPGADGEPAPRHDLRVAGCEGRPRTAGGRRSVESRRQRAPRIGSPCSTPGISLSHIGRRATFTAGTCCRGRESRPGRFVRSRKDSTGTPWCRRRSKLGPNPEMEFAASLMKEGATSAEHRRRAQAGAAPGSLLAKNLRNFTLGK